MVSRYAMYAVQERPFPQVPELALVASDGTERSTTSIYEQYRIPPNLQDHMLAVAGVGRIIAQALPLESVDVTRVTQTLLLHDLGNIIKYDLTKPELFGNEPSDTASLALFAALQTEFQERYGTNPELATAIIMRELGIAADVIVLLEQLDMRRLREVLTHGSWEEKIVLYADQRVSPYGVVSMDERIADVLVRYPHLHDVITAGLENCRVLENQLAGEMGWHPSEITPDQVHTHFAELRQFVFPVYQDHPLANTR